MYIPRRVLIASISSMNIIHGAILLAVANRFRILSSVSPRYFEKISGLDNGKDENPYDSIAEANDIPFDRNDIQH